MRINALLSGLSPVAVRGGENSLPSLGGAQGSIGQATLPADVFEQGQAWKNLSTVSRSGVTGARPCGCKTCAACAARAYTEQAGLKNDSSAPVVAPVAEGTEVAEASGASAEGGEPAHENPPAAGGPKGVTGEALSQAQRLQVAELDQIDTRVRAHEMAHLAAAGSYATGGMTFQYATGPDGKRYAVGGEVGIDTGKESSPEATISKMQTVRAAALAPADPSAQDQKVAAQAAQVIAEASQELQMVRLEQAKGKAENPASVQTGVGEASSPQAGGASAVANDQPPDKGAAGRQQPPANAQQAAAVVAGLMRPAARMHIAV